MTMPAPKRIVNLDAGVVMVVTDLHGDWPLYERYRDVFLGLRDRGLAETLVFTGDLIHSESPPDFDRSLEIVLDLLDLRQELGANLIVLLGNHEMPHIYHISLAKGAHLYTPRFEAAMDRHREAILAFFDGLPFYVRTPAGVSICHAGAFTEAQNSVALGRLFTFSHRRLLEMAVAQLPPEQRPSLRKGLGKLAGTPYAELARRYLEVTRPDDPRYDDYLIGYVASNYPDFDLLWSALFTRNEFESNEDLYATHVAALLRHLADGYHPQNVLVAGHIGCRGGYRIVAGGRQLRLASGAHAQPCKAARYLLFNASRPVTRAEDLVAGMGSVFDT